MKLKEKLFKPNTVIYIGMDFKENEVYIINVSTRKIYSYPQKAGVNTNLNIAIGFGLVFAAIIPGIAEQFRSQLYMSEDYRSFKVLLVAIGILTGLLTFLLRLILEKKYSLQLDEHLKKHPQSVEVNDINKALGKAAFLAISALIFILIGAIGSAIMFGRFLGDSNLGTYLWSVLLFAVFSFLIAGIKHYIFILGLEGQELEKQSKNE